MPRKKDTSHAPDEQAQSEQNMEQQDGAGLDAADAPAPSDAEPAPQEKDAAPEEAGPSGEDAPAGEDTPSEEDAPAGEDTPAGEGQPEGWLEGQSPVEEFQPVQEAGFPGEGPEDGGTAPGDGEAQQSGDRPSPADPAYDALLQEWGEAGGVPAGDGSGIVEDALTLDPLPGEEPQPVPDTPPVEPGVDGGGVTPSVERGQRRRAAAAQPSASSPSAARRAQERERVLTIEARDEVQTEEDQEAAIWHEIQNADWTRRILTGTLDGVEQTESGLTLAIVSYKGFRVAIPIKEMLLYTGPMPTGPEYMVLMDRLRRILLTRLGSEIDFMVKGHDNKSRSAVGSRKDAMYRKRQTFYLDKDELGEPMIYEGRVVQARVVAVAEKIIRVEVFGVECAIVARGLSRSWVGDAAERYSVGDRILVRVLKVSGTTVEDLSITVDVRSVFKAGDQDNLKKCVVQGRYAGQVTDIRGGVVYIRLNNGVNAIAHSCYDRRTPGKRDDVSFSVTRLDPEQGVAIGIITRIIKQNL